MYNQKLMSALKKIGSHTGKFVLKSTMVMNTNTLSPKKKTALDCITYGINKLYSLDESLKLSWFNWSYFGMKSITDNEVDLLMESSASASEIYLMKHFRHDVMKSTTDQNILNFWDFITKDFKDDNITKTDFNQNQYVI